MLTGVTYRIRLCSGEEMFWIYLGQQGDDAWWKDKETHRVFRESSLMYSWEIVDQERDTEGV